MDPEIVSKICLELGISGERGIGNTITPKGGRSIGNTDSAMDRVKERYDEIVKTRLEAKKVSEKKEEKKESPGTEEELITRDTGRISAIPLDPRFSDVWELYKVQQKSFWPAEKIKFAEDKIAIRTLPAKIKESLKKVLGYFAGSDEIVARNLRTRFLNEIKVPEIIVGLDYQTMMENIHSEVYNLAIQNLFPEEERKALFEAIHLNKTVRAKAEWAEKWIRSSRPFRERNVAWAAVEGLHFSSSFAFIDWLKTQKYNLKGVYDLNTEISRDEAQHTRMTALVHSKLLKKCDRLKVKEILDDAMVVEFEFIDDIIPEEGFLGLSRSSMKQHVRHCANIIATMLGHKKLYGATACPFIFMTGRSLTSKENFFETEGMQYNIADIGHGDDDFEISPLD